MRIAAYENFITKLLMSSKCMDINEIDKYIIRTTSYNYHLVKKQLDRTKNLLKERYERYGCLTEEDNIEALKKGYYDLGKIGLTLEEIRKKISRFSIEKESPMGIQIEKDWNYAAFLLQDLLQLENMNLITYSNLLDERLKELADNKANRNNIASEKKKGQDKKGQTEKMNAQSMPPNDFITLKDACALLHLSESKIYHMTSAHEIPHYKINKGKKGRLLFKRSELEAWLTKNRIGTTEEFCFQFEN